MIAAIRDVLIIAVLAWLIITVNNALEGKVPVQTVVMKIWNGK